MAVRIVSHLHSSMRGTIAGVTYSKNQYVPIYMKQWVPPSHPRTPLQGKIVEGFTGAIASINEKILIEPELVSLWHDWFNLMTASETSSYAFVNPLIGVLTLQSMAQGYGIAFTNDLFPNPPQFIVHPLFAVTMSAPDSGTGIKVSVKSTNGIAGTAFVQISPAYHRGRRACPNVYETRKNLWISCPLVTGGDVTFDSLLVDAIYFIRVRFLSNSSTEGVQGVWTEDEIIVRQQSFSEA